MMKDLDLFHSFGWTATTITRPYKWCSSWQQNKKLFGAFWDRVRWMLLAIKIKMPLFIPSSPQHSVLPHNMLFKVDPVSGQFIP